MTAWTIPSYAEWAVPGYTEERLLGHGVSGRVVAAVNDATGQRVAIKYFDARLVNDTEFLQGFRSEAERLRSLDASHMVRLFHYVEEPGQGAAVVTELVDGVSLREVIARRGPLSAVAALLVLKDSLLGLAAAHSRRVPHRDLKPDNVLIDAGGWCTLTDFGVAVKADKQMPAPGSPAYMAPELWHGAPSVPATDMYAAAAVFYESVTGKPPFSGRPGQLRHQHESAPVPLDGLDQPLQDLIAWGMAKNPADRPRNARSFLNELEGRAGAEYGPYWEAEGRRELAERAAALLPLLAGGGGGSATATRRARRKVLTFVSVAAAAMIVLGARGRGRAIEKVRQRPAEQLVRRGLRGPGHGDAAGRGVQVHHRDHVHVQRHGHRHRTGDAVLPVAVLVGEAGSGADVELYRGRGPAGERRDRQGQQGGHRVGRDQGAQPRGEDLQQGHVQAAVQHGQQRDRRCRRRCSRRPRPCPRARRRRRP